MLRKLSIQSLTFSSVLALAAASGAAWAANDADQQADRSSSSGLSQQDASSSSTMSGSDSSSTMQQSADAGSSTSGAATGASSMDNSQQSASASTQQGANIEPLRNEDDLAELSGKTVVNMQGEEIGKVDSIVRDRTDQSLKAVIQSGGFFGVGGEKVAVSVDDLQLESDDRVRLDTPMTKDQLQQTASAYDEQNYEPIGGSQQATGSSTGQQPAGSAAGGSQRG